MLLTEDGFVPLPQVVLLLNDISFMKMITIDY